MPKARGPAPQPERPELKLLRSKAAAPRRTPVPASRPPAAPSWLTPSQRSTWKRVTAEMEAAEIGVHAIDTDVLVAYCCAVSTMAEAAQLLAKDGVIIDGVHRGKVRHPATIIFGQNARLVDSLAASLGLSPDSRSRMRLPVPDTEAAYAGDPYCA